MCRIERIGKSKLEQKLLTLASQDNGNKMDVVVFVGKVYESEIGRY